MEGTCITHTTYNTHTHTHTHTYTMMCLFHLKDEGILERIQQHKPVFIEPKQKSNLQNVSVSCYHYNNVLHDVYTQTMDAFYAKINDPEYYGAMFLAVCRGKVCVM